jgi:uncharacterized protein
MAASGGKIRGAVTATEPTLRLLDSIAAAHGLTDRPHRAPAAPQGTATELGDTATLLDLDEPMLRDRLAIAAAAPVRSREDLAATFGRSLAACCGLATGAAAFASATAATVALANAAQQKKQGSILCIGDAADRLSPIAVQRLTVDEVTDAFLASASLLVVELELDPQFSPLPRLLLAARRHGVAIAIDETRTAFRAAATTITQAEGLQPDFVLVGPQLTAGLPFAAVVGLAAAGDASALLLTVATCALDALREHPLHATLTAQLRDLGDAIRIAAVQQDVHCALAGREGLPRLRFAGQEGAPAELIAHHFELELKTAGCRAHGPLMLPSLLRLDGEKRTAVERAFAYALLRVRALLIEFNSHLSGGIPWVFPSGHAVLRERGLTFYRFPRLANVDVGPVGDAMRIAFGKDRLGAVTSSGFFVPTRITGDATLTIRYVLRQWNAGPDSACLGLFFQNEASSARYYAQVISTAEAPDVRTVAAGFEGNVVGRVRIEGDTGWLRLSRRNGRMHVSHRAAGASEFVELGQCLATSDALIAGCKIWSKVETDGLVADLFELQIDGDVAAEQPAVLGARKDPRLP